MEKINQETIATKETKKRGRPKKKDTTRNPRKPVDGADFDRIEGGRCPKCHMSGGRVRNTLPWENGIRVRYQMCRRCGYLFKSAEIYKQIE